MTAYGRLTTQSQTGMKYLQHLSSRIMSLMCTTCHQLLCKMQQPYTPPFLFADSFSGFVQGLASYSVSLVATENATLTPILNAMEMYLVEPITEVATDSGDARAMMSIQENFGVEKNWMGDPCAPKAFAWIGLTCSYPPAHASKITALNVSSFGLAGTISTDFGDLNALQYLLVRDLSSNDLYGTIPDSLQKSQNGTLSLRVGNNANICANGTACGSSRKKINGALLAAIVIPIVAVIAIFVVLFLLLRQKLKGKDKRKATGPEDESALLENREFSYRELKYITSNYSQEIGKGGFGAVFLGYLKNGNSVAVKVRSDSSSQGGKEFLAEARHLTRIHHKNLVSLIGYCKDKNHLALVYVYMPKGNLQNHLRGSTSKPLTWEQRLHIALDAAQGLEYLHIACKPALIHRDVKSTNILLTTDLGAKIADFGLTKAFGDSKTHITTEPAGTMGYLDPEYFCSYHISEKSDVYSFGVVLLELITGRPPIIPVSDSVSVHVGEWVQQSLDHGAMESIVDARMVGDYDMNSVWKAAGLALHCKLEVSRERPTMAEVVAQLKECLELENRLDGRQRSLGSNFPREGSALEAEEEQQGGDIQAVAAGPAMR
ncbi:probable LRR receptor-like serine/threonine-protein kinase At4g20450 [Triticum aestivum]|uniref:probable LRR receptor-like serine/threonine-protein kinase At4g20450 n=1 Tax=Triticum aestivum TaxID=4565 RepID=UPI001D01A338|nr:probable LRR receptor-like serine/threonine-protein kinase At4g20450 [Triticum aestivum]